MKQLIFFAFVLLISSCGRKLPKDVLPPEKMQSIYWDLMRADEMVNYYAVSDTSYKRTINQEKYYEAIFRMHDIDKDAFRKSKEYYESHPELLKLVLDSMFKQGERLQSIPAPPVPKPLVDSPKPQRVLPIDSTNARDRLLIRDGN